MSTSSVRHLLAKTIESAPGATKEGLKLIKIGNVVDVLDDKGTPGSTDSNKGTGAAPLSLSRTSVKKMLSSAFHRWMKPNLPRGLKTSSHSVVPAAYLRRTPERTIEVKPSHSMFFSNQVFDLPSECFIDADCCNFASTCDLTPNPTERYYTYATSRQRHSCSRPISTASDFSAAYQGKSQWPP